MVEDTTYCKDCQSIQGTQLREFTSYQLVSTSRTIFPIRFVYLRSAQLHPAVLYIQSGQLRPIISLLNGLNRVTGSPIIQLVYSKLLVC